MKRLNHILTLLILTGLLLPSTARAESWGGGGGWGGGRPKVRERMEQRIEEIYGQLSLSEEQKVLLKENKAKHKVTRQALGERLRQTMQAMGDELKKTDLDMSKIDALHGQLKMLRNQMADERMNAILQVRRILTQEQFVKFSDMIKDRRDEL